MRAILQRVLNARVEISGSSAGEIGRGWLVLVGVDKDDSSHDINVLSDKILGLRLFSDEQGRFNQSVVDVAGEILIVSQFTLFADCSRGRRPSFTQSAPVDVAIPLYEAFVKNMKASGLKVSTGVFGADMQVSLVNDGPVTIFLDTKTKVTQGEPK